MADDYMQIAKQLHDKSLELDTKLRTLQKINGEVIVKCDKIIGCLNDFKGTPPLPNARHEPDVSSLAADSVKLVGPRPTSVSIRG